MFLLGDSHAMSVAPGLALAVRGRYQLRMFFVHRFGVLPSCPAPHACRLAEPPSRQTALLRRRAAAL